MWNDINNMIKSISHKVYQNRKGIITDEPQLVRQVLENRAELSSAERLLLYTALLLGQPVSNTLTYRDNSP